MDRANDTNTDGTPGGVYHDLTDAAAWTRRAFLGRSLLFASAAASVPAFLQASAGAATQPGAGMASIPGTPEDRVLVVIQLGGGNDGLNTVVPYGFDDYQRARPGIAVRGDQALRLGGAAREPLGFHPSMGGVKSLFDDGLVSVVQGVGYPNPNRSHFQSMDIWQTAEPTGTGQGWLGRFIDSECCGYGAGESGRASGAGAGSIEPPIALGREAPLALVGKSSKPVSFETPDLFRWTGADAHPSLEKPYEQLVGAGAGGDHHDNPVASFLTRTSLDARVSSDTIRRATELRPLTRYPGTDLGRQLSMVSNMIRAGMKTRVYYVTLGGFDTHARQGGAGGRHANLLRQFSDGVKAFYDDLRAQGNDGRVLTMSFSEFGRRVSQNASGGTDHGTAAPMLLFGPMVRAGVLNAHPSLTNLDDGDLRHTVDFRSVYAGVLGDWMKADAREVLGGRYEAAPVIARG